MALDITAQDIIIDETTGPQDDDINPALPPHSTNDTLTYLLGLDGPGGLASPEVAFQSDFVIATASAGETITSVILTQNASGTPFSTTAGVNSGIKTVDGNYVWLFQDATHPNVVIGVIGTSDANAAPAASGPLAFSFALMNTATTGHFDLYTVQYVPLFNPIATDPDDRIDLTNKVFASVAGTSVVGFSGQNAAPGNHDFYVINSPDDASKQILVTGFLGTSNATANVSTQGFGVNNQSINPTETLQVDFVTGGNLAAGTASQIQYGSHLENITQAGFTINQITPSNPNLRVDIKISAFNVDNNEQGLNFYDGSPTHAAPITSLSLTGQSGYASAITANGTYPTGSGNITVSGMGTGVVTITGLDNITTVNITTSSPMDRLTVSGVDANEGCDITEFHFNTTTTNAYTEQVGSFINFDDDGPALSITAAPVVGAAEVVEASGVAGQSQATITPPTFNASAVDGYTTNVTYALALAGGTATGLLTTVGNHAITLVADSATQISGMYDSDGDTTLDATAFRVTLSGTTVTLTSLVALEHSNAPQGVGEDNTLDLNGLINVTATVTVTDGDQDVVSQQSSSSGLSLTFDDTDPTITAPFDADPVTAGIQTPEQLGNTVGASASGTFGYDMTDKHTAAEYTAGVSDFADQDSVLPGIQLSLGGNLTGLVPNTQTPFISSSATLQSEDATQATFNWQISYDSDPNTAGDQTATAGGTLVFNKTADTYTITLNDAVEGFTKDILHTSELLSKEPTSNVGHPNIVVEKLFEADSTPETTDRDFFVQFTANSVTNTIKFGLNSTGDSDNATPTDTAWNPGDLVTNNHEDWVSATQSTNGVAGDTIQKGELLTLRFFDTSLGIGTESITPSQTAADMAIKFDGIGTSEDLMVILQLVSSTDSSVHTTKAIYIENADIYKMGQVPTAYAADFPLDNNDGLIIIERNDYNGVGENWVIQGAQIMQSGNGIIGPDNPNLAGFQETPTAIDLNRATGSAGGSSQTALVNWDATDNDVLKIVDLGFTSTQTTTPDAHLDFGVQIADADGDTTAVQHILVDIA
ncbi:DUF5801 repeats-in-toxin domain-containing protein [Mesorhizobium sp. WSM4313]|uniref:DUF5801 repeats-in-toxin domain-containing protein n=1 Tax=Mesorhizobium sp. WSM4313 TaxID=2029412 RepID=UPI000BB07CFD|nr:DUF5801 repeats-in-toxin domain-containing protein [Mesorhizobium sp. WSM4313]PBB21709.1 hypothetical protein CK219_03840 [Mesorhizobium sp. WSM4313]